MPQYSASVTSSTAGGYLSIVDSHSTGVTFKASYVKVTNTGASDSVWLNFCTTSATTADYPLVAGTSAAVEISRSHQWLTGISYTSTAASAAPFKVLAIG